MGLCDKCKQNKEIQEHHLWCKFLDNPHGFAWKNYVSRVGLCEECHTKEQGIHPQVIILVLKEFASYPQYSSEYYLWKYVPEDKKERCIDKVVTKSWEWIKDGGDSK